MQNAVVPRNGGRIEMTFQSRGTPSLPWRACFAALIVFLFSIVVPLTTEPRVLQSKRAWVENYHQTATG